MLRVVEPGLHSTVQDAGRTGWGHLGVRRAGAADPLALATANLLVGNPAEVPAVEMTLLGGTFELEADVLLGLAGADMEAHVAEEGRRLEPGASYRLRAGTTVVFGAALDGARTYLALAGGVDAPVVLGSAATDPMAGFGGVHGRPLRPGDVLGARARLTREGTAGTSGPGAEPRRWPIGEPSSGVPLAAGPVDLAVVEGPHLALLAPSLGAALVERSWELTPSCDRVGLRLGGEPLAGAAGLELVSQPMLPGAVQVPPSGLPIVLMPDAPTVGGYPVPAVVASTSMSVAGQLRAGDEVRFGWVSLEEARRRAQTRREWLAAMAVALT